MIAAGPASDVVHALHFSGKLTTVCVVAVARLEDRIPNASGVRAEGITPRPCSNVERRDRHVDDTDYGSVEQGNPANPRLVPADVRRTVLLVHPLKGMEAGQELEGCVRPVRVPGAGDGEVVQGQLGAVAEETELVAARLGRDLVEEGDAAAGRADEHAGQRQDFLPGGPDLVSQYGFTSNMTTKYGPNINL